MAVAADLGVEVDIVKYMLKAERPERSTIEHIVSILEDPVEDLVRKDAQFAKLELDADALVAQAGQGGSFVEVEKDWYPGIRKPADDAYQNVIEEFVQQQLQPFDKRHLLLTSLNEMFAQQQ